MTLLVNSTKRHQGFKKGFATGNGIMGFKHSNTKKVVANTTAK
eukprot:CAMPEP_0202963398 /NCGR_PEP_ID=MMETSP1396-20130829/7385_1 /ASSEMBLY_ACC=CAM_ASM_000872 /TAXON_ID= /ORGANISM="Pseudokeronopsis sp., Strain Brazil" /LENGTH=42 /DNA_ID= /DNA_START= /DNA_END= /DNA_ORIENTATION=